MKIYVNAREFDIVNAYIPPTEDVSETLTVIEEHLRKSTPKHLIIAGDLNSKNMLWGGQLTEDRGTNVLEFVLRNNLTVVNDNNSIPTFQTVNGRSWIDLTITSAPTMKLIEDWEVLDIPNSSDHRYIRTILTQDQTGGSKRLTKMGEYRFLAELTEDEWLKKISGITFMSTEHLDSIIKAFYRKIRTLIDKFSKKIKQQNKDKIAKPWWCPELEIERKRVRALRRRFQRSRNVLREDFKKVYEEVLNRYNELLNVKKDESWKEYCSSIKNKNPFTLPYKLAARKIKEGTIIKAIQKPNREVCNTLLETTEFLLESLYELERVQHSSLQVQASSMAAEEQDRDQIIPFTVNELSGVIKSFRKNIAPGPDLITTRWLVHLYNSNKEFLLNIFNAALRFRYFPKAWRIARVILVPKNRSAENNVDNYRPIAINSIFGKTFEKLIYQRLYFHLTRQGAFPNNQYGFTEGRSAVQALSEIMEAIEDSKVRKEKILIISLDIKNAFGSINKDSAVKELENQQTPQYLIKIVESILSNRRVTYSLPDCTLLCKLKKGTPQGSPLSPLIWNLTITKLLRKSFPDGAKIQAFADDITLTIKAGSRRGLEEAANKALDIVHSWAQSEQLSFSYKKCEFLIRGKEYQKRPPLLYLGGKAIKCVKSLKILGVTFNSSLGFLDHLEIIKNKVQTLTYHLSQFHGNHWGMSPLQLNQIYTRGIERIIAYASPIWFSSNVHILRKLEYSNNST